MMQRLTIRCDLGLEEVEQTAIAVPDDKEGLYDIYDLANDWKEEWAHELLEKIILKLAEYEDLNLTPAQIQEIDSFYTEKCKEVAKLKAEIENLSYIGGELLRENNRLKQNIVDSANDTYSLQELDHKLLNKEIEQLKAELEQSVKLPCKAGDTVYYLKFVNKCDRCEYNHPGKCKFDGKNVKCKENISEIVEKEFCLSMWSIYTEKLIPGFYVTREEAEKALAERKGEK